MTFLVTSSHPEAVKGPQAQNKGTPTSQEIPRGFETLCQEPGQR